MSAEREIVQRLQESRRARRENLPAPVSKLTEGFDVSDYKVFYEKYYDDMEFDEWESKLIKYLNKQDFLDTEDTKLKTEDMAQKAFSLGKAAYFKLLTNPSKDKELTSLLKEFESRTDVPSYMSANDLTRNWKEGLESSKKSSGYVFE